MVTVVKPWLIFLVTYYLLPQFNNGYSSESMVNFCKGSQFDNLKDTDSA